MMHRSVPYSAPILQGKISNALASILPSFEPCTPRPLKLVRCLSCRTFRCARARTACSRSAAGALPGHSTSPGTCMHLDHNPAASVRLSPPFSHANHGMIPPAIVGLSGCTCTMTAQHFPSRARIKIVTSSEGDWTSSEQLAAGAQRRGQAQRAQRAQRSSDNLQRADDLDRLPRRALCQWWHCAGWCAGSCK